MLCRYTPKWKAFKYSTTIQRKQLSQWVEMLNDNEAHNSYSSWQRTDNKWCLFLIPILLDLQIPLPFQMLHFVIIREQALDGIRAAGNHARWSLFSRCNVRLYLGLGSIAADHKRRLVNWNNHHRVRLLTWLSLRKCKMFIRCYNTCTLHIKNMLLHLWRQNRNCRIAYNHV